MVYRPGLPSARVALASRPIERLKKNGAFAPFFFASGSGKYPMLDPVDSATKPLDQRVAQLPWGFRDASKVHVTRSSAYGQKRQFRRERSDVRLTIAVRTALRQLGRLHAANQSLVRNER